MPEFTIENPFVFRTRRPTKLTAKNFRKSASWEKVAGVKNATFLMGKMSPKLVLEMPKRNAGFIREAFDAKKEIGLAIMDGPIKADSQGPVGNFFVLNLGPKRASKNTVIATLEGGSPLDFAVK